MNSLKDAAVLIVVLGLLIVAGAGLWMVARMFIEVSSELIG